MSEVKGVSIGRKARNLSGFAWNVLNYVQQKRGNTVFASREVYSKRVSICNSCDKFIEKKDECGECGCFIPAKAKIILDSCPLKKWDIVHDACAEKFERVFDEMNSEDS